MKMSEKKNTSLNNKGLLCGMCNHGGGGGGVLKNSKERTFSLSICHKYKDQRNSWANMDPSLYILINSAAKICICF